MYTVSERTEPENQGHKRIAMPQVEEPVNEKIEEIALIKRSLDGNIGTITLDNPSKHNALGAALIGELLMALSGLVVTPAQRIGAASVLVSFSPL
jgi:hypothetical protein